MFWISGDGYGIELGIKLIKIEPFHSDSDRIFSTKNNTATLQQKL